MVNELGAIERFYGETENDYRPDFHDFESSWLKEIAAAPYPTEGVTIVMVKMGHADSPYYYLMQTDVYQRFKADLLNVENSSGAVYNNFLKNADFQHGVDIGNWPVSVSPIGQIDIDIEKLDSHFNK